VLSRWPAQIDASNPCKTNDSRIMDPYEATTHPFIVKIWLEEAANEVNTPTWRGRITHVPSGQYSYVDNLDEIVLIIASYLEDSGVKLDIWWRIKRRLARWQGQVKQRGAR
jgi:hypothetical protein